MSITHTDTTHVMDFFDDLVAKMKDEEISYDEALEEAKRFRTEKWDQMDRDSRRHFENNFQTFKEFDFNGVFEFFGNSASA